MEWSNWVRKGDDDDYKNWQEPNGGSRGENNVIMLTGAKTSKKHIRHRWADCKAGHNCKSTPVCQLPGEFFFCCQS